MLYSMATGSLFKANFSFGMANLRLPPVTKCMITALSWRLLQDGRGWCSGHPESSAPVSLSTSNNGHRAPTATELSRPKWVFSVSKDFHAFIIEKTWAGQGTSSSISSFYLYAVILQQSYDLSPEASCCRTQVHINNKQQTSLIPTDYQNPKRGTVWM